MSPIKALARVSVSALFITAGVDTLRNPGPRAALAKPIITQLREKAPGLPDSDEAVVRAQGATHVVAGLALALGKFERLSALVLAASLLPTTAGGHRFWEFDDPMMKKNQQIHFMKNVSIFGGLLYAATSHKSKPAKKKTKKAVAKKGA